MKIKSLLYTLLIVLAIAACRKNNRTPPVPNFKALSLDSLKTLTTDLPKARYADLTFTNAVTGYTIAQGIVAKTINGGLNWSVFNVVDNTPLKKIQFVDNEIGYIIGGDGDKGVLLKTTDAGLNWNKINYGTTAPLNGMFFINKDIGFLVGNDIFTKTTNGGVSWASMKTSDYQLFNDVNFKNNLEGIVTANKGLYYKTTDGGLSWNVAKVLQGNNLGRIYFWENKELLTISSDSLFNVRPPFDLLVKPANAYKLLFINAQQAIGIGNHYDQGFWPYGDIMVSNNGLKTFNQKTFAPAKAIDFEAIARMNDRKVMIIGGGFDGPLVITLNL